MTRRRALLVADVQESFRARRSWESIANPDIATVVGRLVEGFRDAGEPVVWVLYTEPNSGTVFDPVNGYVRVMSELEPRAFELVLTKTSINAFTTAGLAGHFDEMEVGEVVICEIRTEQCCETTARLASDLGFGVVFVTEATPRHRLGPFPLPTSSSAPRPRRAGVRPHLHRLGGPRELCSSRD